MTQHHRSAKITIAHINDTHSHFEPSTIALQIPLDTAEPPMSVYASCGGFSRVSSAVREVKKQALLQGREFMFVHGGDCFQGTLFFSLYKGVANAALLNAIQVEAMVLGNHELDMGNQMVADFMDLTHFPLLAGNWDLSKEHQCKPNPLSPKSNVLAYDNENEHAKYLVKDVDGEPVAMFGLSIENMAGIANPDPDTQFLSVTLVALSTVEAIRRAGINKIVVLSHLGYERDLELAEQIDGIGAIIGGHTHTMQGDFSNIGFGVSDDYAVQINGTCVVQAGCNALALGQLELDFNPDGSVAKVTGKNQLLLGRQFTVDASRSEHLDDSTHQMVKDFLYAQDNIRFCVKDPHVENLLNQNYRPAVRQLQTQKVAVLTEPLRHIRVPDQKGSSQIAPLVVDSFVWSSRQRGHAVDFGIHNAGGVRASLHAGPITAADISGRLLPFAIGLMVYEVSGNQLRAALEGAINNAIDNGVEGTGTGSFPYTSRLKYTYRCCAPEGKRIEALRLYKNGAWEDVQDEVVYLSVSSGYTATGKEGYGALVNTKVEPIPLNITMADAFEEYARNRKSFGAFEQIMVNFIPCGCEQEHVA
ncbi:bifunctional metallophosphatase/5'-nucleotidase [Photobacterium sp. DNB23_23_1]|uniref:Bifunctional metallophosphatase/5'-nucleotidase n=1 Tax=Photobacterium pectinilyticum TaxID=2906793 RepID=A0ABT1N680_9GAMM|nr:bifunctional UDP-sugar hydrolase/5'-nucleotidase [Photobacterium sp. ZSDE20]MCQ1060226.1 bifunctional metallophosphatase/5'-nucleotidase [Photobacterium sp. ZSDE20]MDD1827527.1 bifunctional metallophosphatase/5'-nucleotidase [Photobacterium sp. ZSDE20]